MFKLASRNAAVAFLLIGGVVWNGWLLGFLNHGSAGYVHMSISELEALNQPYENLFDLLELVSGLLLVVGSLALIALVRKPTLLVLIAASIGAIGALTLYDVAHPLDCNQYNNPVCAAKVEANQVSRTNQLHIIESRITAYVTILLTVLVGIWTYVKKLPKSELIFVALVLAATLVTLTIQNYGNNVLTNAISERVWNTVVSLDIIFVAFRLPKAIQRPRSRTRTLA